MAEPGLLGVVMCGGQSRRMGTDKGLIPIDNTTWAGLMYNKITAVHLPAVISVNGQQRDQYAILFDEDRLVVDSLDIDGPVNGLLSVHAQFTAADILMVACDMINMQPDTLQQLIDVYKDEPGFDYYVYQNEAFAEPFCAIYTNEGLKKLSEKYTEEQLSGMSLQKILREGNTRRLPVTDAESFNNFNTQTGI